MAGLVSSVHASRLRGICRAESSVSRAPLSRRSSWIRFCARLPTTGGRVISNVIQTDVAGASAFSLGECNLMQFNVRA
jgi:hypothetical protein